MDEDRFGKKTFIVANAWGIEVETDFLHPDYKLSEVSRDASTGATGHLQLFRIKSSSAGFPEFVVRIGHDDDKAVDVDLIGPDSERAAFAKQATGYIGHKTGSQNTSPSSFKLHIAVPSVGSVFTGTLTIKGLGLGVRV